MSIKNIYLPVSIFHSIQFSTIILNWFQAFIVIPCLTRNLYRYFISLPKFNLGKTEWIRKNKPAAISKYERGYTLIEILIYSLILSLFLLLTTQLFIAIKTANANSLALIGLQKNLCQVMAEMTQTIRSADNIISPPPGETVNQLSLNDGAVTYQIDSGVLTKTDSGQTWALTSKEVAVTGLVFKNPVEVGHTDVVKVSLEFEANYLLKGGEKHSETLETAVSLR